MWITSRLFYWKLTEKKLWISLFFNEIMLFYFVSDVNLNYCPLI